MMRAMPTYLSQPSQFSGDVRIEFRVEFRPVPGDEDPVGYRTVLMVQHPGILGREHRIPFFAWALNVRFRPALWGRPCL